MATFLYGNAATNFGTGANDWLTMTVWALLVDATYVPRPLNDANVSDIPSSSIIARVGPATGKTMVNGLAAAAIPPFLALIWPNPVVAVVLYNKGSLDSNSQLLYYSSDGASFPFQAQGFDYAVQEDLAGGGWFQV